MGNVHTAKWGLLDENNPEDGIKLTYSAGTKCKRSHHSSSSSSSSSSPPLPPAEASMTERARRRQDGEVDRVSLHLRSSDRRWTACHVLLPPPPAGH
eukprot:767012-Hanusia_phi.AAC.8